MKIEATLYIILWGEKKILKHQLYLQRQFHSSCCIWGEKYTLGIYISQVPVSQKIGWKNVFWGWISFLEKCFDSLLFVLHCTIRNVLHAVCKMSDEVTHKFYWKRIDSWSPLLKLFLTWVILKGQDSST